MEYFLSTVFKDVNTPSPFIEKFPEVEGEGAQAAQPDHIYLDAMGFGMGMCCLQVQLQTKTKTKKRKEVALVCKNTYTVESLLMDTSIRWTPL